MVLTQEIYRFDEKYTLQGKEYTASAYLIISYAKREFIISATPDGQTSIEITGFRDPNETIALARVVADAARYARMKFVYQKKKK